MTAPATDFEDDLGDDEEPHRPRHLRYEDPGMTVEEAMRDFPGDPSEGWTGPPMRPGLFGRRKPTAGQPDGPQEPDRRGGGVEEPDTDQDDEDALDRVWKRRSGYEPEPKEPGQAQHYGVLSGIGRMLGIGGKTSESTASLKEPDLGAKPGAPQPAKIPAPAKMPEPVAQRTVKLISPKLMAPVHERLGTGHLNEHHFADMTGADEGKVQVTPSVHDRHGPIAAMNINHPVYTANRYLHKDDDGNLVMHNADFYVNKGQTGTGVGTKLFSRQVENLRKHGVDRIETTAARGDRGAPNSANGYWTWARLGYDGPIPKNVRFDRLPEEFRGAKTVQELMHMPGGAAAWKQHGDTFQATFDLKEGSRNLEILNEYRAEKGLPPVPGTHKATMQASQQPAGLNLTR